MASRPTIPAIHIVDSTDPSGEQSPNPTIDQQSPASLALSPSHQRSTSDPNFLAPSGSNNAPNRYSHDEPPSPTGSASSVHFNTSLALRQNQPNASSGAGSLALLPDPPKQHGRKYSAASLMSEGTEPDHGGHPMSPSGLSATTSITAVPPTPDHKSRFHHSKDGGADAKHDAENEKPPEIVDVEDPTPFAFRPKQLAEIAEDKDVDALAKLGGTEGLLKGLGTDKAHGLSSHAIGEVSNEKSGGEGAYAATIEDRKRVYGVNTMPPQKSKSLLQLMWIALQDKVLVCIYPFLEEPRKFTMVFTDTVMHSGSGITGTWFISRYWRA